MVLVEGIGRPLAGQVEETAAAPLVPPLLHWRLSFWLFGAIGVMWCVLFAIWFRNRPEENRKVNQAELALIRDRLRHSTIPDRACRGARPAAKGPLHGGKGHRGAAGLSPQLPYLRRRVRGRRDLPALDRREQAGCARGMIRRTHAPITTAGAASSRSVAGRCWGPACTS